ncbi:MAG TPA: hypothetical protein VKT73_15110 [Xanthobacteraceae bacterium]|nr:hypothetical protein [Xanthobacteraceae bacterium]
MTLTVKHKFQSAKGDDVDSTLIRPSNWNDTHDIQMASDSVIGRDSSGAGAAQEISFTALARTLAAINDPTAFIAALGIGGFSTGDVKLTLKTTADPGWIIMNDGTIGDASSSSTTRANADCQALFTLLWNNISDTYAPVVGGRGGSAAADWAAHKSITLTKVLGRALAVAGSGSGLSARSLGQNLGEEAHTLVTGEIPAHQHTGNTQSAGDHTHNLALPGNSNLGNNLATVPSANVNTQTTNISNGAQTAGAHTHSFTTDNAGGGGSHNNMQPTSFLNAMIKL